MPYVVYLGNRDAVEQRTNPDGTRTRISVDGKRCTKVVTPEGTSLGEAFTTIIHQSLWSAHSDAPAPAWVASTSPNLGQMLAEHWGCELRAVEEEVSSC